MISPTSPAVHPHGRGAVVDILKASFDLLGSSPRTWGGFLEKLRDESEIRFIPTDVGRFQRLYDRQKGSPVHPHGRGAVLETMKPDPLEPGSSPRTWGGCTALAYDRCGVRFIPTDVGRLTCSDPEGEPCPVHPHGRGAVISELLKVNGRVGSSPRTWGGFRLRSEAHEVRRFIPTDVGRFPTRRRSTRLGPVHPHGRGAVIAVPLTKLPTNGSSPRTWGGY